MDFMNLNQAAHGDREFGFIADPAAASSARRSSGHWRDPEVRARVGAWARAALRDGATADRCGSPASATTCATSRSPRATRSRRSAGSASRVNTWGVSDLVAVVDAVDRRRRSTRSSREYARRVRRRGPSSGPAATAHESLRDGARIELGPARVPRATAASRRFTTNFEDLGGLRQLPGLAVQRLMADGYGFGGEGDWKTAAMVRAMKVMGAGLPGGTSFMEDYTYHLDPGEDDDPRRPHARGLPEHRGHREGRAPASRSTPWPSAASEDPVRLVFDAAAGDRRCVLGIADMRRAVPPRRQRRSRSSRPTQPLPHLPVARAVWRPHPDLRRRRRVLADAQADRTTRCSPPRSPASTWTTSRR